MTDLLLFTVQVLALVILLLVGACFITVLIGLFLRAWRWLDRLQP